MQRSAFIPNRTWLNKRSRAPAYTSHLVTMPAGDNIHTKAQLKGSTLVTETRPNILQTCFKFLACRHGDQVTGYAGARDRWLNHVRLGIRAERCIAAFSDQNQSTQHPKDYNIMANRGHPCFYKNEMALY